MEKANKVSVWVGKFADDDDLTDYIENACDEKGDASNQFRDDTGIDWIDDDFREAGMLQPDLSLRKNLVGFSWIDSFADVLIPELEAMRGVDDNGLIYFITSNTRAHTSRHFRLTGNRSRAGIHSGSARAAHTQALRDRNYRSHPHRARRGSEPRQNRVRV
ncbi:MULTISPECIES: immunity 22 family protein [unclassified Burkholderia]|uniref:immunity 22 family protein n=1 Tax=unclassified Burkholderia TaxID=2613784 RepID=UPI0009E9D640|nr:MULTISPECIES: immunity 22 family protein [unclassified Burkholderia]